MQRRNFLAQSFAASAAASFAGFGYAQAANRNTPEAFYQDFNAALKTNPRLAPVAGVAQDLRCDALQIEGKLPAELKGRFLRNGPALFERNGQRYQHWFAGDGMVQRFAFSGTGVSHLGRFVQTPKFRKEQAVGKFLYPAFNTYIDSDERINGPDAVNAANTNAIEHGGRVLALWEGGSAVAMDPQTLDTIGPVQWQDGWAQMPFSAHPKLDPQGNLWNIGGAGARLLTYHVGADGKLVKAQVAKLPIDAKKAGGMVHDMAITERYMVVPIPPVTMHFDKLGSAATASEVLKTHVGEPLRIWVASKNDVAQFRLFELPTDMVFHVGNAYEQGDEVVLHIVAGNNNDFLAGTAVQLMRGQHGDAGESRLSVLRLNMRTGQIQRTNFSNSEEFPRLDPRFVGRESRYLVSPTSWRVNAAQTAGIGFHGLMLRDFARQTELRYDYGDHTIAEEHIVVPKPGTSNELNAWVMGTSYDIKRGQTAVNVFEAQNIAGGPIARAWLPYAMPLGFHGNFTAT